MTTNDSIHERKTPAAGRPAPLGAARTASDTTATGTHGGLPRRSGLDGWRVITWVLTAAALAVALIAPLSGSTPYMFVLLLSIPLAFIYGVRRYGAKALLLFFAVTFVVSNFFENLSISTGFPSATITTPVAPS